MRVAMQWVPSPMVLCLVSALAAPARAAPPPAVRPPAAGNPTAAVWKQQHVDFFYSGRTARYSCDGMRDKVRAMLLDLGARRDVKITAIGCDDYERVHDTAMGPSLAIVFSSPALPDPSLKPLHEGDLAATDARFETFMITSDAFRNLGVGDCELVEEFARQILPKLATRDLRRDITCVPNQLASSHFLVKGEILRPLPRAEQPVGR
jgi:hypothetical protein